MVFFIYKFPLILPAHILVLSSDVTGKSIVDVIGEGVEDVD
jgi:hypothetical protein